MFIYRTYITAIIIVGICLIATFRRGLTALSAPLFKADPDLAPSSTETSMVWGSNAASCGHVDVRADGFLGSRTSHGYDRSTSVMISRNLTKLLVLAHTSDDDISWVRERLPDLPVVAYCANDDSADNHPPKNKGHEVVNYLTYLIDHYNDIQADVVVFVHAHRYATHNNDLLQFDAAQMIRRLRPEHVTRQAYFNMRCHWTPGCPGGLDPSSEREELSKQEQVVLLESWSELFPQYQPPTRLAQACCAQFAVSRDLIQGIPRSRFVYFRDWMLKTSLSTYIAGRIWEYSWQYLFTNESVSCPAEHECYCDGYGLCYGGKEGFKAVVGAHANVSGRTLASDETKTDIRERNRL